MKKAGIFFGDPDDAKSIVSSTILNDEMVRSLYFYARASGDHDKTYYPEGSLVVEGQTSLYGNVFTSKPISTSSDRRLKEKIKALVPKRAMELIRKLKPKAFVLKNSKKSHYGFIAQDVRDVCDWDVVDENEGFLSISYLDFMADIVAALQDMDKRLAKLEETRRTKK